MSKKITKARQREYGERRTALFELGFKTYTEYLASPLWASIRAKVIRPGTRCAGGCERYATQVHHGKYTLAVLKGRDLRHLYPVCGGCHLSSEFTARGEKLNPTRATNKLTRRARRRGRPLRSIRKMKRHERHNPQLKIESTPEDIASAEATLADYRARLKTWKHPRKRRTP